jgi:MFS family permease
MYIGGLHKMDKKTLSSVISQKEFQAMFMLIFNSFSWYFPLFFFLTDTVEYMQLGYTQLLTVFGLHYAAIAIFAFLGNLLAERYGRNRLLSLWIFIGVGASASMFLLNPAQEGMLYFTSFCLGISLGLGFPSCLAFFADHSTVGSKGLFGGITFALTFLGICLLGFMTTLTDFATSVLIFTLWRLAGLLFFFYLKPEEKINQTKISYFRILRQKSLILYFIPWIMFCLVNFFEVPFFDTQLQQHYLGTNLSYVISIGEFGIGAISALVGGYLSDIIGRKRLIIAAYVIVGIGYAVLSISFMTPVVFYIYVLLDGVVWGIFMLMFFLIIWGDLAEEHLKNRYYLIGNLPFILSTFLPIIVKPYIGTVPLFTAFSLASFFLFLAIIPLIYAPETLPEKQIKDRELRGYIDKAQKIKEKYA